MGTVSAVFEVTEDRYATWSHVFQGGNTTWLFFDTRQIMGNFFLGLQGQTFNGWNTRIPPRSTILAATMEFTPFDTRIGAYSTTMNTPDRAGEIFSHRAVQKPFQLYEGWSQDGWSNMDIDVDGNTGLGIIETSGGVSNASWILKQAIEIGAVSSWRENLAELITWPAAAVTVIGTATLQMIRTGNPAGSMRLQLRDTVFEKFIRVPGPNILAVSDDILVSAVPTAPATGSPIAFQFTGADQIDPGVGSEVCLVLDADYSVVSGNYVSTRHQNQFLTIGRQMHFGTGRAADWQNYPGVLELNQALANPGNSIAGEDVIWGIGNYTAGVTETSPDITSLLQAQIDAPNYTIDSGILINLTRGSDSNQGRIMRSGYHNPGPGPILRVTYEEPEEKRHFYKTFRRQSATLIPQHDTFD